MQPRLTRDQWNTLPLNTICWNQEFPEALFQVRLGRGLDRRLFFYSGVTDSAWAKRDDGWCPTPDWTRVAYDPRVRLPQGV